MIASRTAGRTVIAAVPSIELDGSVAVIVASPVLLPAVTRPLDETDAVELAEVDQVTDVVRLLVLASEYVPVAVNCWVSPDGRFVAGGVTAMARRTGVTTVITAVPSTDW